MVKRRITIQIAALTPQVSQYPKGRRAMPYKTYSDMKAPFVASQVVLGPKT